MMKKLLSSVLGILFATIAVHAQGVTFDYVSQIGGTAANVKSGDFDRNRTLAVDKDGYVYNFGIMATGEPDFDVLSGVKTLKSGDGMLFIAKYDSMQNLIWAKQIGGVASPVQPNALALDSLSNIYLGGTFRGNMDLSTGPVNEYVSSKGSLDAFIVKLDSAGNFVWGKDIGSAGATTQLQALTVNAAGDIFATGYFYQPVDFAPGSTNSTLTGGGAYVLKLNTKGDFGWVKHLESASGRSIALDKDGNVLSSGVLVTTPGKGTPYKAKADFNPSPAPADTFYLKSAGDGDIYVSKLDKNGDFVWARNFGGKRLDQGLSIALDESGAVYTTGLFNDTADFNPWGSSYKMVSKKLSEVFVSKLDADGNFIWAKQIDGEGAHRGFSIDVGRNRGLGIYVTGDFKGITDFYKGKDTVVLDGGTGNTFLLKLDTAGVFQWAYKTGGSISATVAVDNRGNVFTAGWFNSDSADFNPDPNQTFIANKIGSLDGFIHKMKWCSFSDTITESVCKIFVYEDTAFYNTGVYVLTNPEGCDSSSVIVLDLTIFNLNPNITIQEDTLSTTQSYDSYQWMKNGLLITNATNNKYTVSENGDYQVIVTNVAGCIDTSDVYVVTNKTNIGNNNSILNKLMVFPNPATDIVNISSPVPINIQLTSIEGKVLIDKKNVKTFSVSHLPSSIYFLRIFNEEGELLKMEKIIK